MSPFVKVPSGHGGPVRTEASRRGAGRGGTERTLRLRGHNREWGAPTGRPSSGVSSMGHGTWPDFCRMNDGNLLLSHSSGARNLDSAGDFEDTDCSFLVKKEKNIRRE